MASSNIKLFDENKGNMLTDTEFSISNQRMNGLQAGIASSQLQNKAMYQASLVAYAIAQVMMQNGLNANDTDAVSTFVANLSGTMLQKVYDIATTEEAQAGVATGKWMSPALVKAAIDKTLSDKNFLQKSGGTMTGNLILNADPTANLGAATKQYVDAEISAVKAPNIPYVLYTSKNGSGSSVEISLPNSSGYIIQAKVKYTKDGSTKRKYLNVQQLINGTIIQVDEGSSTADSKSILSVSTGEGDADAYFSIDAFPVKAWLNDNYAATAFGLICKACSSSGSSNASSAEASNTNISFDHPSKDLSSYVNNNIKFIFNAFCTYKILVYKYNI